MGRASFHVIDGVDVVGARAEGLSNLHDRVIGQWTALVGEMKWAVPGLLGIDAKFETMRRRLFLDQVVGTLLGFIVV